jgi:hypothetical protein
MVSTFTGFNKTIKLLGHMKITTALSFLSVIIFFFVACEKQPGEGGTSTIHGSIITKEYNGNFKILRAVYPAAKEDVYIIYGGDSTKFYGNHSNTSWDGTYEFNFLQEGNYIVFAYSKDSTFDYNLTSEKIAIMRRVEITGKNQTIEVPVIYVLK